MSFHDGVKIEIKPEENIFDVLSMNYVVKKKKCFKNLDQSFENSIVENNHNGILCNTNCVDPEYFTEDGVKHEEDVSEVSFKNKKSNKGFYKTRSAEIQNDPNPVLSLGHLSQGCVKIKENYIRKEEILKNANLGDKTDSEVLDSQGYVAPVRTNVNEDPQKRCFSRDGVKQESKQSENIFEVSFDDTENDKCFKEINLNVEDTVVEAQHNNPLPVKHLSQDVIKTEKHQENITSEKKEKIIANANISLEDETSAEELNTDIYNPTRIIPIRNDINRVPFACTMCASCFTQKTDLEEHMQQHNGLKPHICELCGKVLSNRGNLRQHIIRHTGEKPHVCKVCNKGFSQNNELKRHSLFHAKHKPYGCEMCEKRFYRKSDLRRHLLVHAGEKPHVCEVCQRGFLRKFDLTEHLFTHTGEKPYVCEVCDRKFSRRWSLKQHYIVHTQEKPYKCERCDKRFGKKACLIQHLKVHTQEKPFVCEVCGKAFSRKATLSDHILLHTGEQPHICETCNKGFSRIVDLERHVLIHSGKRPYSCEMCNKTFTQKGDLTRHAQVHSSVTHLCTLCSKVFKKKQDLKAHMSYRCKK